MVIWGYGVNLDLADEIFLKDYISGFQKVSNHTLGIKCSVLDLEFNRIGGSDLILAMGLTEDDISKLLTDPNINTYRQRAIIEKKVIKFLAIRSFAKIGTIIGIVTNSPIINSETQNVVALHVYMHYLDIFNISSLLARYYKNGDLAINQLNGPVLTEREKQVVFFFLLNLESSTIAEVLSKIENKRITKNSIDQVFSKQLLPKFNVYSRKALFDKLYYNGYTRIVPQNILKEGIMVDITDYVIFY